MKHLFFSITLLLILIGCSNKQEEKNIHASEDIKEVAWEFIKEKGWTANNKEDWQSAVVKDTVADNRYELLDDNFEGENVLSISFKDKESAVSGTPVILVNPNNKEVIGYMLGE